jgi:hypothetical protein
MRITIIPSEKFIKVDGDQLIDILEDLSWIPLDIRAVQWYDTWGEVEYNDGKPNSIIQELGIFENAILTFNKEKDRINRQKLIEEEIKELSRDYWEELRLLRNRKLSESDWTQSRDIILENDDEWKNYRQILRDIPNKIDNPKEMVNNPNHPNWPKEP